jgi:polyhydroxybutyrate depolymerase
MIKWFFRVALIILGVMVVLVLSVLLAYRLVNRTNGTLVSSGKQRNYLLYVPESYDPSKPTPLVISLHGLIQRPANQMKLTHWNDLADRYGFIVVYPSGTRFPLRWNAGGSYGADTDPAQDVAFISDLIDQLESEYNIDSARIYANGLSNGGGMSFVLSCELSERIAAVGLVAGAYATPGRIAPSGRCQRLSFMAVRIPSSFGRNAGSLRCPFRTSTWVDTLAQRNGCDEFPKSFLQR